MALHHIPDEDVSVQAARRQQGAVRGPREARDTESVAPAWPELSLCRDADRRLNLWSNWGTCRWYEAARSMLL